MRRYLSTFLVLISFITTCSSLHAEEILNPLIDQQAFLEDVSNSHKLREERRITEEQFLQMAKSSDTIVLDARSAVGYARMHIQGAKNLPFTDFTKETLSSLIPKKGTRILIYCNNNVANSPIAFATKAPAASLNLSTFTALYTYGYQNVYELGPVIDPATSKIKFEGSFINP